jgi:hypothetical protein
MAWEIARRRGWIVKDPLKDIDLLDTSSVKGYLEGEDLAAVGEERPVVTKSRGLLGPRDDLPQPS